MPLTDYSNPEVLFRSNWEVARRMNWDGTPTLPPTFVAEAGRRLWVVDIREPGDLVGPTGHVPGTWRMPLDRVGQIRQVLAPDTAVVLVCEDGQKSSIAARFLMEMGMDAVAAMDGGMLAWRAEGYAASRDARVIEAMLARPEPGHGSDGRPLLRHFDGEPKHLTRDQIVEHLGDVAKVRRVKLAAIFLADQMSCVDGREDRAIVGTPGGDAGDLLLGLAAVEDLGGTIDLSKMPDITRAYADAFGGVYLHTDNHALNRLIRSLRADPKVAPLVEGVITATEWQAFLRDPPPELRRSLLDHLFAPDHVGCGHIKLSMNKPDAYHVRPEVITSFFQAFFESLWGGARDLHWNVLGGDHNEGAVVNVELDEAPLQPFSEIPMIAPSVGGAQMFVMHPQVVEALREQGARFLHSRIRNLLPLAETQLDSLIGAMKTIGGEQGLATLTALAGGLPTFNVRFDPTGTFELAQGDAIPTA